jgi:ribosomal protein L11 methyltransferase
MALELRVYPGCRVIDIGTGSGILAIAALRLGAAFALGVDPDEAALKAARENFESNGLDATLAAGSADRLAASSADVTVANINATVLLSILDDLLLCTRPAGSLILTGFTADELPAVLANFDEYSVLGIDEWRCVMLTLS